MDVRIERRPEAYFACIRVVGPYGERVQEAFGRLMAWAGPRGLLQDGTRVSGLSHDDPHSVPAEQLRFDACIAVGGDTATDGEVHTEEIAECDWAVTMHVGPFEALAHTYEELGTWIEEHGRVPAGPCVETYLDDPGVTPVVELRTEVAVPLA